ncbi:MAG: hypothetical protein IH608_12805, partial [Proteobacteria bacterium]|nr:hypothetical protein [Pseudomonadota bacterium]
FAQARDAAGEFREIVRSWDGPPEALEEKLFREHYQDEWRINSEPNVRNCLSLLIRRSREAEAA